MITIFTDGASRGNPGPGGFGAVIATEDHVTELGGREDVTTNNRMELSGLICALTFIKKHVDGGDVALYLDSKYVLRGAQEWLHAWQAGGWKTKAKKDVLNRDLWETTAVLLRDVQSKCTLKWNYVGGHVGIPGNERVDEIATAFADARMIQLFSGLKEDYGYDLSVTVGDEAKKTKKSRSDTPAYSYISMVNGNIETHKTWAECEKRVKGVPRTKFQKVFSAQEEKEVIASYKAL